MIFKTNLWLVGFSWDGYGSYVFFCVAHCMFRGSERSSFMLEAHQSVFSENLPCDGSRKASKEC